MEIFMHPSEVPDDLLQFFEPVDPSAKLDVWKIATQPYAKSHFATYPPALVEPCILAGTSARGVCPACGAPWERVVEREKPPASVYATNGKPESIAAISHPDIGKAAMGQKLQNWYNAHPPQTTGWSPTCACGRADTVPAIVLDPFNGSGTTGMVARKHGRRYVGLDISASYLRELALPRAEQKQTAASLAALPLFGGAA